MFLLEENTNLNSPFFISWKEKKKRKSICASLCLSHAHLLFRRRTCSLRKRTPATFSMFFDVINKLLVFLLRPCSFVSVFLLTTRFPHCNLWKQLRGRKRELTNLTNPREKVCEREKKSPLKAKTLSE